MSHITASLASLTPEEAASHREFGHILAKGHDAPHAEDLEAIDRHAKAFAALVKSEPYDATTHEHDKVREEQHRRDMKELDAHLKPAREFAAARIRRVEEEVAKRDKGHVHPVLSSWIVWSAIVVLALTIAPTLHDQIFITMSDDVLAWLASATCATVVGGFVVWSLLGSAAIAHQRSALNVLGLVSGVGIGIGMGVLRLAHATSFAEYVFAGALTVVEVSTVIAVEFVANALRSNYHAWLMQEQEASPFRADLEAARHDEARCLEAIHCIDERRAAHLAHIEMRHARHFHIDDIYQAAKGEIEQGYYEQIAANWHLRQGSVVGGVSVHSTIRRVA